MKAGAFTPATPAVRIESTSVLRRSMKAGAFTPATPAIAADARQEFAAQ